MIEFYDTHAHLAYPDFAPDLPQVIERALAAGVTRIITVGTDLESSRRVIELSERFDPVFAVVGWHPNEAHLAPPDFSATLRALAGHPRVVGLGETGLDYYRLPSPDQPGAAEANAQLRRCQAEVFQQHLEVAAQLGLNCVIHQRSALEDVLAMLQPFAGRVRPVFHCFAEAPEALPRIFALEGLVSYTGILTFKNGANIRAALSATPLDQLMLETDCPFLAPVPHRGRRCEPAHVMDTAQAAAAVKGCSLQELSEATCATARAFFHRRSSA